MTTLQEALEKIANALPAYIDGVAASEYLAVVHTALAQQGGMSEPTGWDNGLSQDYDRKLGAWFADRPGAKQQLREDVGYRNSDKAHCPTHFIPVPPPEKARGE